MLFMIIPVGVPWRCSTDPVIGVWRQRADFEPRVDYRRYGTLIVKDVQAAVGDDFPKGVVNQFPETVIAHLRECYPGAFVKIERTASGSGEELLIEGTITESREFGVLEEPHMGPQIMVGEQEIAVLIVKASLADGATNRGLGDITMERKASYSLRHDGIFLEDVGRDIAAAVAEKRGLAVLRRIEYWGNVNRYGLKAERCYR